MDSMLLTPPGQWLMYAAVMAGCVMTMSRYLVAFATVCIAAGAAHADDTEFCARLRDEASAEAALLYAPRVEVLGAHAPTVVEPGDPSSTAAQRFQVRGALVVSPVDMLRGRAVERVAAADCWQRIAVAEIERVLEAGARYGELAAKRAEIAHLDSHLGEIDQLVNDAATRLERQRATAFEIDELHHERATLRSRIADLRVELAGLEELERDAPARPLAELAERYRRAALESGDRRADVRALTAWQFDVRGGVAGGDRADWFAMAELRYSLGARWQAAADRRAHASRADELARYDRELPSRIAQLQRILERSVAALDSEVHMLDEEIAIVRTDRARLDGLADNTDDAARRLRTRYTVEMIQLEGRRVGAVTLAAARRNLLGKTL